MGTNGIQTSQPTGTGGGVTNAIVESVLGAGKNITGSLPQTTQNSEAIDAAGYQLGINAGVRAYNIGLVKDYKDACKTVKDLAGGG
jgi:hypothetical protein